jgi:hypothetical protein
MPTYEETRERMGLLQKFDPTPRNLEDYIQYAIMGPLGPVAQVGEQLTGLEIGRTGASLGTEVVAGEAGRIGATAAGASIGSAAGPVGTLVGGVIGYIGGGFGSGYFSNKAAQKIRGDEDVSEGEAIAAGFINLVPGGGLSKGGVKTALAKGAVKGAAIGAASETIETGIDEGRLPTIGELMGTTISSAAFGSALGVSSKAVEKVVGMNPRQLDDALKRGDDAEVIHFVDKIRGLTGERVRPAMDTIYSHLKPSEVIGKRNVQHVRDYQGTVAEAKVIGSYFNETTKTFIKQQTKNPQERQQISELLTDYFVGDIGVDDVPQQYRKILPKIDEHRVKIGELQREKLALHDAGEIEMPAHIAEAIRSSEVEGSWATRQYRMFRDKKWKDDPTLRKNALDEIMSQKHPSVLDQRRTITVGQKTVIVDGKKEIIKGEKVLNPNFGQPKKGAKARNYTEEEATEILNDLKLNRNSTPADTWGALAKIYKTRKNVSPAVRKWMGEIKSVGEVGNMSLTDLAVDVAKSQTDVNIKNTLLELGLARVNDGSWNVGNEVRLSLKGKGYEKPDIGDIAVDPKIQSTLEHFYTNQAHAKLGKGFMALMDDLVSTGVSASKFVKVPLNAAAYPIQVYSNTSSLASNGILPLNPKTWKSWAKKAGGDLKEAATLAAMDQGAMRGYILKRLGDEPKALADFAKLNLITNADVNQDMLAGLKRGKIGDWFHKGASKVASVYGAPDAMFRIFYQLQLEDQFSTLLKQGLDSGTLAKSDVRKVAAHFNRKTFTNYGEVPESFRQGSRLGVFGQFSTFSFDLARTEWGKFETIQMMRNPDKFRDELQTVLGKEVGLNDIDTQKIAAEGNKRLGWLLGTYATISAGIAGFNRIQGGVSREEEKALRETVLPEWSENQNLVLTKDDEGNITYSNASYYAPQAQFLGYFKAFMRGESFEEAATNMAKSIWDDYGGEGTFLGKNIYSAIFNTDLQTKKNISNSTSAMRQFLDRAGYVVKESFTPQQLKEFQKWARGMPVDQKVMRTLGIRIQPTNIEKGLSFTVRDLSQKKRQISSALASATYNADEKGFQKSLMDHQELHEDIKRHYDNLIVLGYDQDKAIESLSGGGLSKGDIFNAIDGIYRPPQYSDLSKVSEAYDKAQKMQPDEREDFLQTLDPATQGEVVRRMGKAERHPEWNQREKYIFSMGSKNGERARYVMERFQGPEAVQEIKSLHRKGIINDEDLKKILKLQRVQD